jgi:hypothetical protein
MKEKTKHILKIVFRAIHDILRYLVTGKKESDL